MSTASTLHFAMTGPIERGRLIKGRPSYRWFVGYSQVTAAGGVIVPPMTKTEAQWHARERGCRAVFHPTLVAAFAAVEAPTK